MRPYSSHSADPFLNRIIGVRKAVQRAEFGLTITDQNFRHMHPFNHLVHQADGTGSTRHDSGTQRRGFVAFKAFVAQFRKKHGWHAVQSGALFQRYRLKGIACIEDGSRKDSGSAVCYTYEVAQYHTETVVKRYRNTKPLSGLHSHFPTGKIGVVQNIVVGQRGALGASCCAAGELNIDRIMGIKTPFNQSKLVSFPFASHVPYFREIEDTRRRRITNAYYGFQLR